MASPSLSYRLARRALRSAASGPLRRAVKIRGHFPTDDAVTKLIYRVLRDAAAEWKLAPREWGEAKSKFAIMFEERFITR